MAVPEGILSFAWVAATTVMAPAVFGLGVVRRLGLRTGVGAATTWGFAYVIGQWSLAHATALWLLLGQPVPGVVLPIAAVAIGLLACRRGRGNVPSPPQAQAPAPHWWLVVAATTLAIGALAFECLHANAQPIRFSDEAEIWAAKAKVLYGAATIPVGEGLTMVSHGDYPNLNPLVQVLAFAASGRVLHWENRLPLQCFAVALLLLLAGALRHRAAWLAAAAVVACGSSLGTGIVTAAYADVPLACAVLATVDALRRWRETGERVWWRLAWLSLAAMLATKNEGAMLALAILVPVAIWWWRVREPDGSRRRLCSRDVLWLLAPAVTLGLHFAFNAAHALHNDLVGSGAGGGLVARLVSQAPTHVPAVAAFFARMAIDANPHRLLPLLCVVAALAAAFSGGRRWLRTPAAMVTCIFVLAAGGYAMVFVATPADVNWHLATAAARTLEHVVPIATLALCMTIARHPLDATAATKAAAH